MMMNIILYCFIFMQFASSQYSDDIFDKLFKRSSALGNLDYSDYNSLCNCEFPYPCQGARNDYDTYDDDSKVEVVYVDPEQLDNVYKFIINHMNTPSTETGYNENTDEVTTQVPTRPETTVESTEANYTPAPDYKATSTTRVEEETDDNYQSPVEDISNSESHDSNSEDIDNQWEYGSLTTSSYTAGDTTEPATEGEMESTQKTEYEEYNDYNSGKDSQEDPNIVKNVDYSEDADAGNSQEINNSKPEDITSWLTL